MDGEIGDGSQRRDGDVRVDLGLHDEPSTFVTK